ncbi:receptor-type tyrosine-protein phosphatase F-like [Haliotis asinina]|uniref:receptor-type tyrosine-protein phosphatase F-like n=1 Tax=Haliotis asinina TaxID=109174 RepID=UPI003531B693
MWNHEQHSRGMMYTVHVHQRQFNTSEREITVCDLHPAMNYALHVACIPLRYGSGETTGFYSDNTSTVAKTLEDVPSGVPVVKTGCFVYSDCETPQCIATIYWRPIPLEESNGEITQYTIKQEDTQHGTSKVIKVPGSATSYDLKVMGDREYSITLTGETRVGVSAESKPVVIPACSNMSPPLDIVVEADSSTLYIIWRVPQGSRDTHHGRVTSYTLFYCNGSKITSKCGDNIHWLPFDSDITQYEWKVPDGNLDNKMVGVSVEKETANGNVSSGIRWNTCVWRRNYKPPSPRGVTFSRYQPDNSLSLEWQRLGCDETPVYVRYYVVSHCTVNNYGGCAGPPVIANVSNTEESHVITGLSAGVKYRVTLRAVSRAGEGPESDPIIKLVENSDLRPEQIVGISVGGVFGCVVLVSFVVCCARKLRKTYRGMPLDIKLPTLTGIKNDETFIRETVTLETKDILKKGIQPKYPSIEKGIVNKENIVDREGEVTPPTTLGTGHNTSEKSRSNLETDSEIVKSPCGLGDTPGSDREREKAKTSIKNKADPSSIQVDSYLKLSLSGNSTRPEPGSDYVTRHELSLMVGKPSCDASCDKTSHSSGQDAASSPPPPYEPPRSPGDQKLETPPPTYSSYVSSQTDFPSAPLGRQIFPCLVGGNSSHPLSVLPGQQPPSSFPCGDASYDESQSHEESTSFQDHVTPKPQSHSTDSPYIPFDKIQPQTPQPPEEQKTVPPPADGYVSVSEASKMINVD